MPFPFLPAGLVLAAAVLASAYAVFTLFLRVFDRAAFTARNSIAPGIVAGLRTWSHDPLADRVTSSPAAAQAPGLRRADVARAAADAASAAIVELVDLDDAGAVPMETVRRR
jgi:hypothetical protein